MATKKYVVRSGFICVIALINVAGSAYERTYEGGEEVTLDDEQAAAHLHKLEFAAQKDRDAALAAEKEAQIKAAAAQSPVDLVSQLTAALGQSMTAAGQSAAPAAA